ncbi:MAG: IS630 family transposase [Prochloraceae cyanobacterium]|nr:IS630 family transposase [Prochloraceae cyanobacterium]
MPKKIVLSDRLSPEDLLVKYKSETNASAKIRYQIVWLLSTGKSPLEVASVTGYSRTWIYQVIARYNQGGIEALEDLRKHNQGKEPLLNDVQQAQLHQVLSGPAPDGGLWNGPKVAQWMSEITGQEISPSARMGISKTNGIQPQSTTSSASGSFSRRTNRMEKKLGLKLEFLQAKYPNAEIELWSEDEHRLGLQPILRRVWTPIGDQPIADVKIQYQWLWLYGFVHPYFPRVIDVVLSKYKTKTKVVAGMRMRRAYPHTHPPRILYRSVYVFAS